MRPRRIAAAFVLVGAMAAGVPAFVREVRTAFHDAPMRMISPELEAQVRGINAKLPPSVPLLYFDGPGDYWNSRLWQRAFYPRRVYLLHHGSWGPRWPEPEELHRVFSTRWALSAGTPPEDPGFAWHDALPPIPGSTSAIWFGELR